MSSDEPYASETKLVETVSFVLSFLRDVGLVSAEQALLQEMHEKFPEILDSSIGVEHEESTPEREAAAPTSDDSAFAEANNGMSLARTPGDGLEFSARPQHLVKGQDSASTNRSTPEDHALGRSSAQELASTSWISSPWGKDVDEYDNMDDVGYKRTYIPSQEQFVELELDIASEKGSSEPYFVHSGRVDALADFDFQGSESGIDDREQQQQSPPCAPSGSPAQGSGMHQGSCPEFGNVAPDETWDLGPMDIKLAEPVTTPNKSPVDRSGDESRPVLSRVESLSSSFVDFDLERLEDDTCMGRSGQPSEIEQLSEADEIQFNPPVTELDVVTPNDLEVCSQGIHGMSRTSSTDVVQLPAVAPVVHDGLVAQKESTGGGFSFPVTPSADDTGPKVFKSWPSVRSSSTSEPRPSLDDVSASAADYADDGYRSKLSSRTPSLIMGDAGPCSPSLKQPHKNQQQQQQQKPFSDSGIMGAYSKDASMNMPGSQTSPAGSKGLSDGAKDDSTDAPSPSSGSGGRKHSDMSRDAVGSSPCGHDAVYEQEQDASASLSDSDVVFGTLSSGLVAGDISAHRISVEEQASQDMSGGVHTQGSGTSSTGDADSASLVGDPNDAQRLDLLDWQETSGEAEDLEEAAASGPDVGTPQPSYSKDETGAIIYHYDPEYISRQYEVFPLQIIHRRHHTGFEETKDFPIRMNDLIAGRYQVMDFLGSAAFSRAVQALDVRTNSLVCLKIVKNNKDYFDQSLDEIKLLNYVNSHDPRDEHGVVRLYDYFYYKEHLFLVCELLRANLYEFQKYNKESGEEPYFTTARIQKIAISVLRSLAYLHSLGLIHSDLKPENILIKSYSRCEVKVIDLGSSCFVTDQLSSYVQSRSYRAPEVILGLPYDQKVDIWSLGCILAELSSGYVLFQNDSVATLLARLQGILGAIPEWMIRKGRFASRFFTRNGQVYEKQQHSSGGTERYELLVSKRTSLRHRVPEADAGLLSFMSYLLAVDPHKRPTAAQALSHPWLQHTYPSLDSM